MSFKAWLSVFLPYGATFLFVQLATRVFLLFYSGGLSEASGLALAQIFTLGLFYDMIALGFFLVPVIAFHLSPRTSGKTARTALFFILTYIWLFAAASEYFFWEEFGTRFNFIAVDYLVYTTEVIDNIRESYPLYPILAALGALTAAATWLWRQRLASPISRGGRFFRATGLALIALPFIVCFATPDNIAPDMANNQSLQELGKNGTYSLFSAYRNNELDFKGFYLTKSEKEVADGMRRLLEEDENDFLNNDPNDITRVIRRTGPELHKNVIMVVMESMSADYMGVFKNKKSLTPVLDKLSTEGLFFSKLYATGTRTVRGLEALSLSVPPTPGQSILRRKDNGNLFTIGTVFQDRGYDTAFIYGGHGYFDNMNAFFSANGFRIVDRMAFADKDVHFSNAWGVCDEDLYDQVIREADTAREQKKPFFHMVMTTSNHRPYTFPEGRIDAPQGARASAVRYADYAVSAFLDKARSKPWFNDTVFIFVADHTAGAGGKASLSINKYHIPAIVYAPGFIKPQRYDLTASQIDIPPVILGLLNFSYKTKFFGEDLLNDADEAEHAHAFISNYQKIALLKNDTLVVLEPKRINEEYKDDKEVSETDEDPRLLLDTVSYYQYASGWRTRMKRIPTTLD